MRHMAQPFEQRLPVSDAVARHTHQLHVRAVSQQPVLQVAPHAVGDGQCNHQRSHSGGNSSNGNGGHNAHHGLSPLGLQVSSRQKKFKSHRAYFFAGTENTALATPTLSCRS